MAAAEPIPGRLAHDPEDLMRLFNQLFESTENTVLLRGGTEPLYLPADEGDGRNRILFAHGFFASALHEVAHWCIAGRRRRQLVDYGYWYRPDGRDTTQQAAFEAVEARPQAIEWAFSICCGVPFRVSVDNLDGAPVDHRRFARRVHVALCRYAAVGFPGRARRLMDALSDFYSCAFCLPPAP